MKNKIEYCKKTKKFIYSSEAKAIRAMNRYPDIKRVYYCGHCDGYHTTSMGTGLAIQEGIISKPEKLKDISSKDLQDEIDRLQKIIDKKEE